MSKQPTQTVDEMMAIARGHIEAFAAEPTRTIGRYESAARAILREGGYPEDWNLCRVEGTPEQRERFLARLPAEQRAGYYQGPDFTPRAEFALKVLIYIKDWRAAVARGDAAHATMRMEQMAACFNEIRRLEGPRASREKKRNAQAAYEGLAEAMFPGERPLSKSNRRKLRDAWKKQHPQLSQSDRNLSRWEEDCGLK